MITGSGRVSLQSGRIQRYRVGFGYNMRVCARGPLGRGASRPAELRKPRTREEAGWAEPRIRPESLRKLENPFSFSKLFYKLQTNLNSDQI
jgi:hypothetical protein